MAVAEREPLPKVTIDLSTHQFTSDWVTTTIRGKTSWPVLLFLASKPLEKIPIEELSKVILQTGGENSDSPYKSIYNLRRQIGADNGRPLIATIKGSGNGGREVLGYSFLAVVNLVKGEQTFLPSMDAAEFSSLYEGQIAKIRQRIYYKVGNNPDAEDLAQEVFLNAWRANVKGSYRSKGKFVSWINQIAHNKVVDYYEETSRRNTISLEGMDIVVPDRSDPAFLLERQFESHRLRWVISKLPEDQKMVLMARCIDGMEYDEIAKMMTKGEGNIRVILTRAKRRLRNLLAEDSWTK